MSTLTPIACNPNGVSLPHRLFDIVALPHQADPEQQARNQAKGMLPQGIARLGNEPLRKVFP
jgi:hypothetical protein